MKNYSRQREAILKVVCSTDTHPTADWIYTEARKELPNISLGTVYRNLSRLKEAGELLSLDFGDGKEHFDGNNKAHLHLVCKKCGKIADALLNQDPLDKINNDYGFIAETPVYIVYGICRDCK